ncbi:hypothetical protein [Sulfuriflexus sp.]|uniref:hypothetical protein n=1 Tax=Sulfuriflexus sp. TaxID=2015443 RepID=UPI0028CCF37C|nr:hypothetical protein [Sulfuriflexus sp.]MDT8404453.1 hypothetical protein [Sulfuriflexus sp.]
MTITRLLPLFLSLILAPLAQALEKSVYAPLHEKVETGETRLSAYFSIKLSGGIMRPRVLETFHHQGDKKVQIGLVKFSEYSPRQNGYAISADGKTLLYFHRDLPASKVVNKRSGLYEFRHGHGDKLLHRDANNSEYLEEKLPANTVVFGVYKKEANSFRIQGEVYTRDTDGREKRLQ